ncbi:7682_t:CDS:2, partial [Funneliformis caledonium]
MLCLSDYSKQVLNINGIISSTILSQPPKFNYISYIEYISQDIITKFVNNYITINFEEDTFSSMHRDLLFEEIWKMFLNQCHSLKSITLPNIKIMNYLGEDNSVKNIRKLKCSTESDSSLFLYLSQICQNISKIIIIQNKNLEENEIGLNTLIESQEKIEEIKIESFMNIENISLAKALRKHINSLQSITLKNFNSLPSSLFQNTEFPNLKILKIKLINDLKILDSIKLPNLEILEILNNSILIDQTIDLYSKLISTITNGNLKKINIEVSNDQCLDDLKEFIEIITNCCNKMEYLTLWVNDKLIDNLEKLLINCKNLKHLTLNKATDLDWELVDDEFSVENLDDETKSVNNVLNQSIEKRKTSEPSSWLEFLTKSVGIGVQTSEFKFLSILATNSSNNLSEIIIRGDWNFTRKDLVKFFETLKEKDSFKPLKLQIVNNKTSIETINDVCKKYSEE